MKVNPVFIPPEGKDTNKSMCDICKQYRVYYGDVRRCPSCGSTEEVKDKEAGDFLKNEYASEPLVAHRKDPKKQRSPDFPANAQIIDDVEMER